jgi:hypothetical protein
VDAPNHICSGLHGFTRRVRVLLVLVLAVAAARCINGSGESAVPTPTPPTVTSVAVTGAGESANPGQTTQLTASATYSDGSTATVTEQATWVSANSSIATVSATGLVTFVAVGMARLTVSAAPVPRYQLTGRITDADNNRGVENVRVEVTEGPDAQRAATTDVDGMYTLSNLAAGTFNVKITHSKYEAETLAVTLSGPTRLDVALRPIQLTPPTATAYGTYSITFTVTSQNCSTPVVPGPTGELTLSGKADGTQLSVKIVERDTTRTYKNGRLEVDGRFSASGGGLIAGVTTSASTGGPGIDSHEFTGSVSGRVSGRKIEGSEKITYAAPCPGSKATIAFSGSK